MTAAYKILYEYTMSQINDDHQARAIVDFALLEAGQVLVGSSAGCGRGGRNKINNMKTIYKYRLPDKINKLMIPAGGIVLTIQLQDDIPTIWVLVNPSNPEKERIFHLVGTGHKIEIRAGAHPVYVGTVQIDWHVWHCFEVFK